MAGKLMQIPNNDTQNTPTVDKQITISSEKSMKAP